jgi:hypothetical protein
MNFETFTEVFEYNINILENKKIKCHRADFGPHHSEGLLGWPSRSPREMGSMLVGMW